jgi:hypothetical protein
MCPESVEDKAEMEKIPFRSAVGSLMYLVTGTRPDIAVAVGQVSKFCENPGTAHWAAVKRILRYLKGTLDFGLKCNPTDLELVGYSDADWAGDLDSRRSTTGYLFQLGGFPISWRSKRQSTVALSTAEAEYMALASACQEVIWLRRLLKGFDIDQSKSTVLFEDNQGCIAMSKNPVHHDRTKHIDIKYHFIRETISNGEVVITYKETENMLADILTKGLPRDRHMMLCSKMNLVENPLTSSERGVLKVFPQVKEKKGTEEN